MDLDLTDKTAFISGSTQGIGFAVARALAAEGAAVVLNGRTHGSVEAAIERLTGELPAARVSGVAADFADAGQVRDLLAEITDVDIVVNNVGLFEVAPFESVPDEQWQHYFEVNVMSGVRLARQVLGPMTRRGWGRLVFVSSESGVDVPGDMVHYGATKAAMAATANGLAKLTRGTQVTVNTVLGGPTWSDGVARAVAKVAEDTSVDPEQLREAIATGRTTSLLQRFIEPEEIANLVLYLASPRSSATNGAALRADGGVLPTTL